MPKNKKRSKFIPIILILVLTAAVTYIARQDIYDDSIPVINKPIPDTDSLSSHCAIMMDLTENRVCYEKNSAEKVPIASLTKIMTALVAIENLDSLSREFVFTEEIVDEMKRVNASVAGFLPGESVPARDILYGLMLPSGGDAAIGIAILTAGDQARFLTMMNQRAAQIGMYNTHFSDVTGLDDNGNYSTAKDMALLFTEALENPEFKRIITTKEYLTKPTTEHPNGILLNSTLSEPIKEYSLEGKILGGKTGYTTGAGLCLASFAEEEGHRYILVTLGAGDGSKYPSYHFEDAWVLYERYENT